MYYYQFFKTIYMSDKITNIIMTMKYIYQMIIWNIKWYFNMMFPFSNIIIETYHTNTFMTKIMSFILKICMIIYANTMYFIYSRKKYLHNTTTNNDSRKILVKFCNNKLKINKIIKISELDNLIIELLDDKKSYNMNKIFVFNKYPKFILNEINYTYYDGKNVDMLKYLKGLSYDESLTFNDIICFTDIKYNDLNNIIVKYFHLFENRQTTYNIRDIVNNKLEFITNIEQ